MRHRDQWDLLVEDPAGRAENAVEEILRYDTSVMINPPNRVASEDIEIGGVTIPKGDVLTPFFGSGNRDPARYTNPDDLDILRPNVRPLLSFGGGPHICLGQHLARVEAEVSIATFARRFPQMELADPNPKRRYGITNRGFEALPVRLA
jgi:cytochrome P450